jgi:hypothetical protein
VTADTVIKVIGLILTVAALVFTGYQIRQTNKTLIFTTEQGLYKESRDILRYIADHPAMVTAAQLEDDSLLDLKAKVELNAQIGVLLNFYNSILSNRNQPYVSPEFRRDLIKDFCEVAKYPQIKKRIGDAPDKPFHALYEIKRSSCGA